MCAIRNHSGYTNETDWSHKLCVLSPCGSLSSSSKQIENRDTKHITHEHFLTTLYMSFIEPVGHQTRAFSLGIVPSIHTNEGRLINIDRY